MNPFWLYLLRRVVVALVVAFALVLFHSLARHGGARW